MTTTGTPRVIIADQDSLLSPQILDSLAANGMATSIAADWATLLTDVATLSPDAIVLDQWLGGQNILYQLPELRRLTDVSILLMLSHRAEVDRIVGLELGADDCLLKPISGSELAARLRAHLRRGRHRHPPASPPGVAMAAVPAPASRPVAADHAAAAWRMELAERRLYRPDGGILRLTATEFDLLAVLARTPGEPISREELAKLLQGREYRSSDRSLDSMVYQLRRKLGRRQCGECIIAVRNRGYSFVGFPED